MKKGTVKIINIDSCKKSISVQIFIENILIDQIGELIDKGFHYFAFLLICQGIEYLGCFFDHLPFDAKNMSEKRFKKGLKELFKNSFYKNNLTWLYTNLRGSMVHQLRPSRNIILTSNTLNKCPLSKHLKLENDQRIFVIEAFYKDFHKACQRLLKMFETKKYLLLSGKDKYLEEYLNIFDIEIGNLSVEVSGSAIGYVIIK